MSTTDPIYGTDEPEETPEEKFQAAEIMRALANMARDRGLVTLADLGPITPDELRPYVDRLTEAVGGDA